MTREDLSALDIPASEITTRVVDGVPEACVNFAGMMRLVFRSPKPEAQALRDWFFAEVLPSVAEHGCYPPPESGTVAGRGRVIVRPDRARLAGLVRAIGLPWTWETR